MQFGPMAGQVNVRVTGDRLVGGGQVPDLQAGGMKDLEIDEPMTPGLISVNALQVLLPTMDLTIGQSFTVMALDAAEGTVTPITITVAGTEEVTVPAGTFSTFRVELSGMEAPIHFYLSTDDGRIIKVEQVGQPVAFELAGN